MTARSQPSSSSSPSSSPPSSALPLAYQEYVDRVGAFAKSPAPAYTLAGLFGLASPLGFAGGRDRARLPDRVPGEQALRSALARQGSTAASAAAKAIGNTASHPQQVSALPFRALPPFWQLAGFAAAFAGGGYITDCGDHLNGAGTVTAWSLIYLFFNGGNALRRPGPLPLTLTGSVLAAATIHGAHYFSRTSWKGAVPGLTDQNASVTS